MLLPDLDGVTPGGWGIRRPWKKRNLFEVQQKIVEEQGWHSRLRKLPCVASSNLNWPSTRTFHTRQCGCVSLVRDSAHQRKKWTYISMNLLKMHIAKRFPGMELLPSKKSVWLVCHGAMEALDIPSTQNRFRVDMFRLPFLTIGWIPKKNLGARFQPCQIRISCNRTWAFRKKTVRCECQRAKISQNLKLNLPKT